jgi:hypothetical protein
MKIELNTKGIVELDKSNKEQIMELMQYLRDLKENSWIQYEATKKNSYWDLLKDASEDIFELIKYFKDIWLDVVNLNPKRKYI